MKLSTKIKKYVPYGLIFGSKLEIGDYTCMKIVLMIDGKRTGFETHSLYMADEYDRHLRKDKHCSLLPLNECPVVNPTEIIMHYTSTTYSDWCNK